MKCPQCRRISDTIFQVYNGNPECEICYEKNKNFSMYPCGHLYCSECINNYITKSENDIDENSTIEENSIVENSNNEILESDRKIVFQNNGIVNNLEWIFNINEWVLIEYDFNGNKKEGFFQGGSYFNVPRTPIGWHTEWVNNNIKEFRRWRLIKNPNIEIFYYLNKAVHWRLDLEYNRWVLYEQNDELELWNRCKENMNIKPLTPDGWYTYWSKKKSVWIMIKI